MVYSRRVSFGRYFERSHQILKSALGGHFVGLRYVPSMQCSLAISIHSYFLRFLRKADRGRPSGFALGVLNVGRAVALARREALGFPSMSRNLMTAPRVGASSRVPSYFTRPFALRKKIALSTSASGRPIGVVSDCFSPNNQGPPVRLRAVGGPIENFHLRE
jgi:hypothetical protein